MSCPDGAKCHHSCGEMCWRVRTCLPLTTFGEDWPEDVKAKHAEPDGVPRVEDLLIGGSHAGPEA